MKLSKLMVSIMVSAVVLGVTSSYVSATSFIQIGEGQKCGKLNVVVESGFFYYQCVKKGKLKVWTAQGVVASATSTSTSTTTTTTTIPPRTLFSKVDNLQTFLNTYGKSVVTISCGGSQGSAVSITNSFNSGWQIESGAKSQLITNRHVVNSCGKSVSDWRLNQVTIESNGATYVGYVNAFSTYADYISGAAVDLAGVMTAFEIPKSDIWSNNTPTPKLGHAVVAVGSSGGTSGVTTSGEIAAITSREITTTAAAGHGSSGGALFNNSGQLIGIIYAGNGSLTQVIPITRFCDFVQSCNPNISFKE